MDNQQAQKVLLLYRPGGGDTADLEVRQAMECVARDPALREWFERHCVFQNAMREQFRQIEVPANLRRQILEQPLRRGRIVWWKNPSVLAAAAAVVLMIGLAGTLVSPSKPDGLVAYRERMVRTALRSYRMNLVTRDLNQIRDYLTKNSDHGDFLLTKELETLPGEGCALLSWQGRKVSMICLASREQKDLYFFVINRVDLPGAPMSETPQFNQVNKLMTATWSRGDKTYILAGQLDEPSLRKYL